MVTLADNFNRADGALGANWTQRGDTQAIVVASNKATAASTSNTDVAHVTHITAAAGAAMVSQATFQWSSATNVYAAIELSNSLSIQAMTMGIFDGTNLFIRDYDGNIGNTRVTKAFSLASNTPHLFRIESSPGGIVDLWVNGVRELTNAYGSPRPLRGVGFAARGLVTVDNWTGGDLAMVPGELGTFTLGTEALGHYVPATVVPGAPAVVIATLDTRQVARTSMGLR